MEIVSVINYKGGVGKTTVTSNLAADLAWNGKSVLILDMQKIGVRSCNHAFVLIGSVYG